MLKLTSLAAGILTLGLAAPAATAAPLGAARDNPAAGESLVETVQGYHRSCYWTGTGWGYKSGVKVLVCKPHKPAGTGWVWHHEGPRHGWYHGKRKSWHHNKW